MIGVEISERSRRQAILMKLVAVFMASFFRCANGGGSGGDQNYAISHGQL